MASSMRIKLHRKTEYTSKQPQHEHLPPTPLRGLLLGPSAAGKTSVLVDLVLRLYRGCFSRIYVFSPSVHLDPTWAPIKTYAEQTLGVDPNEEQWAFDTWDPEALQNIFETQVQLIQEAKKRQKQLFNILLICDDFADDPRVSHQSGGSTSGGSMLNTLFVRGRHAYISTLVSSQKTQAHLTGH